MAHIMPPKPAIAKPSRLTCSRCGRQIDINDLYKSESSFFNTYKKVPFCKDCIDDLYQEFYERYSKQGYNMPERKAVERICMVLDIYFKELFFQRAMAQYEKAPETSVIMFYIRESRTGRNYRKTYDDTVKERFEASKEEKEIKSIYDDDDAEFDMRIEKGKKIFGQGYERSDYIFLYDQYSDWTARHECGTKSQEELFKNICLTQLSLNKAQKTNNVSEIKQLNDAYIKLLDSAKLQPKQNAGDTTAENQTLGTLIDKWENTRPVPEIDEELKDVDKIGLYIDVFFRGHLAKMLNIKNAFSHLYNKFMEKYTVRKPEYADEEDNEALFDAVFGSTSMDEESSYRDDEGVV